MSPHPAVYTVLLPAPAGRVQGAGLQGQKQSEPPSLGSLSGVLLGTGFNREQILVLSFVILVLSNVSSSLPSTVAQTLTSAHFLGHHPTPRIMLSLGFTAPAGSSASPEMMINPTSGFSQPDSFSLFLGLAYSLSVWLCLASVGGSKIPL